MPPRVVFADPAFRYVYQENLSLVHDVEKIDSALGLADHVSDNRSGEKLPDFVLDRSNGFVSKFILPGFVFVHPESLDHWVLEIGNYFLAIVLVHQHARDAEKRGARSIQKRENRVV